MRALSYLFAGALFGCGLAVAGMTNPAKIVGFLDVTGKWDPTLAMVMAGSMTVYLVGGRKVLKRSAPAHGGSFPGPPSKHVDKRLVAGSAVFGIGWGLAGICPGPSVANLGRLFVPDQSAEAMVILGFVGAMVAGMLVAQRVFRADR